MNMNLFIKLGAAFAMGVAGTKLVEKGYDMYKERKENQGENGSERERFFADIRKIDEIANKIAEDNKRYKEAEREEEFKKSEEIIKKSRIVRKITKMAIEVLKSIPELKLDPENKEMVKKYSETVKGLKEIKEEIAALECVEENVEKAEKLRAKADTLIEAYTREFDKADEAK
jgi:KaiC/GvpD/RAD55 family RecA-like ATPase